MSFFNFFRKQPGTGANLDTRTSDEILRDYHFGETVASINPVNWIEKSPSTWRKFPIYNQNGSGSCVAQTMAKLMGIMYWLKNGKYVHFSATHIYQRRTNKPSGGMGGVDVFNIAREGVTLEELVPSQSLTDTQMDSYVIDEYKKKVGEVFKIGNFLILPIKDIDTIASIIQTTGKGVMCWSYFKNDEWTEVPSIKYPELNPYAETTGRHSTAYVDFTLYEGEKALITDDSWGTSYGKAGQRVIKESFFKERNLFAAYPMNFAFENNNQPSPVTPTKPKFRFSKKLVFIPWDSNTNCPVDVDLNNSQKVDVIALQNCLKFEGVFPSNIESTGYYGSVTANSVLKFQKKYTIDTEEVLNDLLGREVGPKTRQKLNEIYS